jgi:hypothetical protein
MPDASFIRKEIHVAEVAARLGLKGDGRHFDCFREHSPGKQRRSLSVHTVSNTIRCFTCDTRSLSTIDLVMEVRGYDVGTAVRWFVKNFKGIPMIQIRAKRNRKTYVQARTRPMTLQTLVTSPGWAALSPSAKAVLTTISARCPTAGSERGCLRCTYALLMQWSGLRSRATIAASLHQLRNTGAIQTSVVTTNFRTRRGFWLKELVVRVSPRAMRAPCGTHRTATGYSVQKLNSQYAVQKMNSGSGQTQSVAGKEELEQWEPVEGERVQ